jgi:hypothetical protein
MLEPDEPFTPLRAIIAVVVFELVDDDEIVAQQLLGQPPLRPAAFSCSNWLTRSTKLKKRPLARARMTAEARATHRWVLPVPVPPMKIALSLASTGRCR